MFIQETKRKSREANLGIDNRESKPYVRFSSKMKMFKKNTTNMIVLFTNTKSSAENFLREQREKTLTCFNGGTFGL